MNSARFRQLRKRLSELRRHLLPARFDPTGTYSPRVHERARAYRLLAHAEFESYIEDRVIEILTLRLREWKKSRKVSRCLLGLVAYHEGSSVSNEPTSILNPPRKPSPLLEDRINSASNSFQYYVRNKNHGVKEANLIRMLMQLGLEDSEFDPIWLGAIDSWATLRGTYAHQSATKVQVLPDPQDELRAVQVILNGFAKLDIVIGNL